MLAEKDNVVSIELINCLYLVAEKLIELQNENIDLSYKLEKKQKEFDFVYIRLQQLKKDKN